MKSPFPGTVSAIAELLGRSRGGDGDVVVSGVNTIELATAEQITFCGSKAFSKFLPATNAGCVIVREADVANVAAPSWIISPDPYADMVRLLNTVRTSYTLPEGFRHQGAHIHPEASIAASASIGPGCVVGAGTVIGERTQLLANVVVYGAVSIGSDCVLHANVTVYQSTAIGHRCTVHAGSVIGSDGFGYIERSDKHFEKIPHVGSVRIGNDVEIGANVTIDRAAMGSTVIEDGVKVDNLVQIAHGVRIGEHSAIAAQVAIAGGTAVGKRNRIAGQAGIVGHVVTADDVVVYAQSGVAQSITESGSYFGSPAKQHAQALRMEMALRQLPELLHQIRSMAAELEEVKRGKPS